MHLLLLGGVRMALPGKLLLVMRITAIFLLTTALHVSAASLGQTVSYTGKNVPLEKVFSVVKQQTGYVFFYKAPDLEGIRPVTVDLKDVPLADAMGKILEGQPLQWTMEGNTIFITAKPAPVKPVKQLEEDLSLFYDIHGRVTDSLGNPLAGASVTVKGMKKGTQTGVDGSFVLRDVTGRAMLEVSFTGYEAQHVLWDGKSEVLVRLRQGAVSMQDVVINKGYYTTTQRLNTGDVTKVTSADIEKQPVTNVLQALQGHVPGMLITQTTGAPGGGFNVQIRGQNSFGGSTGGNTNPLYIIDGVPYNAQIPTTPDYPPLLNSVLNGGSPLNYINPYDIESVEVLKDADATAIYGSRAANGAILITTKKGKAGAMRLDLNVNSGISNLAHDMQLMNREQYLTMRREGFRNDGLQPSATDYDVNGVWDSTHYTNWSKVLLGNPAPYLNSQASLSGGNNSVQYLIGADFYRQGTPIPTRIKGDGADQRVSGHFSISSMSADNRFKVLLTGIYAFDVNTVQSIDLARTRIGLVPDAPALYNPDGSLNWAPLVPGQAGTWSNPLAVLNIKYKANTSNFQPNMTMSYTVFRGLDAKLRLGYGYTQTYEVQTFPVSSFDPFYAAMGGATATYQNINTHTWVAEPQLNYSVRTGIGAFSALVGSSFNETDNQVQRLQGEGYISDATLENPQSAATLSINSASSQYKVEGAYFQLNYNLRDEWVVNASGRRDGSSRFGPDKQFANFGSLGGLWIFTQEKAIQKLLPFLSFGKLRASYGITGNEPGGNYEFLNLYNVTSYPYNGAQGLTPANLYNPELAWEVNKKLEGAIDLGFARDRINLSVNWYRNRSNNQLVPEPLAQITGFGSVPANLPALVQNTGWEFLLNTINVKTKNLSWSSSFNLSLNRNKLVAFRNLALSSYASYYIIGKSLSIRKLERFAGVNSTTGFYQFYTNKGQLTYQPSSNTDNTNVVDFTPRFFGGFQNSFQYKGLSLDILFYFIKQRGANMVDLLSYVPGVMANLPVDFLNRWQKPGDKAKYQMYTSAEGSSLAYNTGNSVSLTDFSYTDASFIRLKNVALSYELPARWKQKARLKGCRISVKGENLLTFTHYFGVDPESQGSSLPPMRIYTFGLQLSL